MKLDEILGIAKLDNATLLRLLYIALFVIFVFAPGVSLVILEGNLNLLVSQPTVTLGISLLISIPFLFLGGIVYFSPRKTLIELSKQQISEAKWMFLLGCGFWALVSAGITFAIVNGNSGWLNIHISNNRMIQYMAVWSAELVIWGTILCINLGRKFWG